MKKWLSLGLFVLALLGCQSTVGEPPVPPETTKIEAPEPLSVERTVYMDEMFSTAERDAVFEGMLAWTTATRGIVKWKVGAVEIPKNLFPWRGPGCSKDILMTEAKSNSSLVARLAARCPPDDGEYQTIAYTETQCEYNVTLYVWDLIRDRDSFVSTTIHELGHQLRIHHLPDGALMSRAPEINCLTKADLKAFCDVYGCDSTTLLPCD